MGLDVKTGQFNIGTGAATTTVTLTLGFEMKVILLWWSGRTDSTDAEGSATSLRGFGFATSASSFRALCTRNEDAAGSSIADSGHRADACIAEQGDGAFIGWADVQSVSSTEVIFEIIDAFATDLRVSYLALGGTDIDGEIGTFTSTGTAPVNQTVNTTNVGKAIIFAGIASSVNAPATTTQSWLQIGAATSSSSEYTLSGGSGNNDGTMVTSAYCRGAECVTNHSSATPDTIDCRAEFVSFNSGTPGFTINWLERTGSRRHHYLLLYGTFQVALGDLLTLNTTGTITESGLAFAPTAMMLLSACRAESTIDTVTAHDEWSVGAATSASERVGQNSTARDGNTTAFTMTSIQADEVYINFDPTTDTREGSADFTGFTSDGFTLDMDDADPVESFAWYIAFAAAGGAPIAPKRLLTLGIGSILPLWPAWWRKQRMDKSK